MTIWSAIKTKTTKCDIAPTAQMTEPMVHVLNSFVNKIKHKIKPNKFIYKNTI